MLMAPCRGVHSVELESSRERFAPIIDSHMGASLLFHRFLDQLHSVSLHVWECFHNLGVRLGAFLRRFIGHLERREEV